MTKQLRYFVIGGRPWWVVLSSLWLNDEYEFASGDSNLFQNIRGSPAEPFFIDLRELPRDNYWSVAQFQPQLRQRLPEPMGSFEAYNGEVGLPSDPIEPCAPAVGRRGWKAAKNEAVEVQATCTQNCCHGAGARDRLHSEPCPPGRLDHHGTWIGDAGGARITHKSDRFPRLEPPDQGSGASMFVVLVQADERGGYLIVPEQVAGSAGVLGGHQRDLAENTKGSEGDVLQITDRSAHDEERARHVWVLLYDWKLAESEGRHQGCPDA